MKLLSLLSILFVSLQTFAIQEIEVVVADQSFSSSSKVVISEKEIKKSQVNNISTLLSSEANVAISSSNFTPNSIYIRGGDTSHILFLIDGIPFYDPSTIQRTVNLSTLNLRSIKKIEIIKGSQSVLYGGQALAGVIKIETFPADIKTSTDFTVQGGQRFAEVNIGQQLRINDNQGFAGNIKLTDAYNTSPARDSSKTYPQRLTNVDLTYTLRDLFFSQYEVLVKGQYTDDQSQISTFESATGVSLDTENFNAQTESVNMGLVLRKKDLFSLAFSQQYTERKFEQDSISGAGTETNELYDGLLQIVRLDVKAYESASFKVETGASFNHEDMYYKSSGTVGADQFQEYEGLFVKASYKPTEKIVTEAGVRKELSKMKSVADTYQFGLSYADLIKIEHSTGFKSPSLYQQFSTRGNPNLKPEKVITSAATIEDRLTDTTRGSFTVFTSKYENLIITQGTPSKYQNVSKTETKGVEAYLNYENEQLASRMQFSLGYQEPKDFSSNTWLVRRALRTASLKVNHDLTDKTSLGLEVIHTGSRRDQYFTFTPPFTYSTKTTTLNDYTLTHLVVNHKAAEALNLFARAENIFSEEYQPSYGYYVDGPVVRAGLNYTLE
jgi:iron complex outermembrane receptor protein/vitamin B12 transporter